MLEALDRAKQRESQRLNKRILEPVQINNLNDIKRVLVELDPARAHVADQIPIGARLESAEDGKMVTYAVSAVTRSKSKRDILIEGMELLKRRAAMDAKPPEQQPVLINGREMAPADLGSGVDGMTSIDPLIKHWLGGYREGLMICWKLNDQIYRYDIFLHKLTKIA